MHDTTPIRELEVRHLGTIGYQQAWQLQKQLVDERRKGLIPDTLLLLQHEPVVTLGRDTDPQSLLYNEATLAAVGVELVQSDRGGDATYHGPGQVVGYPILDLRPDWMDIPKFVRAIEQTMIDTIAEYDLVGGRVEGSPGTWLAEDARGPERKIGAVGARISRWITHHGFALNVNTHMDHFELIVPCGIRDKGVTSLKAELGREVSIDEVMRHLAEHLARNFGRRLVVRSQEEDQS
ncbi:MAG: lipoyl(octanoyl) transferase LipB [Bradymonadia bacterium]